MSFTGKVEGSHDIRLVECGKFPLSADWHRYVVYVLVYEHVGVIGENGNTFTSGLPAHFSNMRVCLKCATAHIPAKLHKLVQYLADRSFWSSIEAFTLVLNCSQRSLLDRHLVCLR